MCAIAARTIPSDFDGVGSRLPLHGEHDAALSLYHAAALVSCTLSTTLPMSWRRTGLPLRQVTISGRNAAAF